MAQKCKAVVFREANKPLSIEEVTIASPRRNEVMVKIAACGICHTDFSATNGALPTQPPLVLGHEAAGVIAEVGEGVTDLQVGDHVVISWSPNCGKCSYCTIGRPALCAHEDKSWVTLRDGTTPISDSQGHPISTFAAIGVMAEYATMHRDNAIKIDKSIPLDAASLLGCAVMTGVGAVINTVNVEVGSTVAILGAGGVALSAIQGAVMSGALKIIVVDRSDKRLETAKRFGATHFVNLKTVENPVLKIQQISNGGVDYAFECIGIPETIAQSYECLHKGGTAVIAGLTRMTESVTIPAMMIPFSEKILKGSNYGSARPSVDFPKLIALYQRGLLKLDEMITTRYKITEANKAFEDLIAGKNIRGVIVF